MPRNPPQSDPGVKAVVKAYKLKLHDPDLRAVVYALDLAEAGNVRHGSLADRWRVISDNAKK